MIDVDILKAKLAEAGGDDVAVSARCLQLLIDELEAGRAALARQGMVFGAKGKTL